MKHDWNVFVGQKVDAKKPVLDFRRRQRDQVVVVEEPRRHFQNGVVRPESVNNGLQVDQPLLGLGAVVVAQLTEQLPPQFESSHRQKFILNVYCLLY